MQKNHNSKKGFTLIEMLIASALFGVIGSLALTLFINMSRSSSTFALREIILDDAQFMMNTLVREISDNAIDYEEYFNRTVIKGEFGMNFGQYAAQFYYSEKVNPGQQNNCDNLDITYGGKKDSCINTGKNPPATNKLPGDGSAFTSPNFTAYEDPEKPEEQKIFCKDFDPENELRINKRNYVCVQHLYLISPDGKKKIIIAPEGESEGKGSTHVLSRVEMVWPSKDDQGIFTCNPEKTPCTGGSPEITLMNSAKNKAPKVQIPDVQDLSDKNDDDENEDFIPFTPRRINIRSIKFFLSPVEDPIKAFSEGEDPLKGFSEKEINAKYAIKQPSIMIVLEVEPSANVSSGKESSRITLQKLVTIPILQEIKSFPPHMQCAGPNCDKIHKQ